MGHFLDIISGYLGVCWSMLGKNEKMPQPLVNTGFTAFLCHERAGIRTPDNLIKSQVLYHLSYTPSYYSIVPAYTQANWASWIRTSECRSQSPVPYRLAIAQ